MAYKCRLCRMLSSSMNTANRIKTGRLAKGLTQLELAKLSNISLRSIQRIENGEVKPRSYTLKILAEQLNIEFDFTETAASAELIANAKPVGASGKIPKIIWSCGTGLLLLLCSAAFLSQSARFPETSFETFLFWGGITLVYTFTLSIIWRAD